ncbi:hypothetical protein GCM10020001_046320 [Nonomuraea salmonea]
MVIRDAVSQDWDGIYPFYAAIMVEGRTFPFPERQSLEEARPWWMEQPPGKTVVAVDDDGVIVGSAKMGPNRPGRGVACGHGVVHRGSGAPGQGDRAGAGGVCDRLVPQPEISWHPVQCGG